MSRFAAIDIGTNSTRLLIADVDGSVIKPIHTEINISRIGEGLGVERLLRPAPVDRTVAVLRAYAEAVRGMGLGVARVVATSAVRDATNAGEFVALVREKTGLMVEVISGEEEAYLSYQGASYGVTGERPVVVDIGGGSTEFIWSGPEGSIVCRSLNLGAVRMTEHPRAFADIMTDLKAVFAEIISSNGHDLVGVGGTVTTLAAVDQRLPVYDPGKTHGYFLSGEAVRRMLSFLSSRTMAERRCIPGLQPERADIIVAGTAILSAIIEGLGAPGITVSEADILYGLILSQAVR